MSRTFIGLFNFIYRFFKRFSCISRIAVSIYLRAFSNRSMVKEENLSEGALRSSGNFPLINMSFDKTLLLFFRKFVQGFHGHRSLSKTKILINYVTRLEEGSTEIAPAVSRIRAVAMTRVIF